MRVVDHGRGKPLLLVHGLGSSGHAWEPVLRPLAEARRVMVIDLPGHGASPAEADSGTFDGLVRSVTAWLGENGMNGVDMVGSSMGARLVLELARQGKAGNVVALDPGGFWEGWERKFLVTTLSASRALVKRLKPALPALAGNAISRSALLAQLSARPWDLDGDFVAEELRALAETATVPSLVRDLGYGPGQEGIADTGKRLAIGWGRHDRLCLPVQAGRAAKRFPSAKLHWFEHSGHFPLWDEPRETVKLIAEVCG
ncbi:alpha/beta fold hydrolase [Sphingomonas glaciei]|uniref:Alpha/beta fold hydrolase n=1 Tax=Sphingomonas glaciei TaxID=2938948 RepID=A0ABY5MV64_9SPHN|nr:alpha/beta fold hydrolase [Sphingomonas glaciei]UUR07874.1 alpha/beta fold hydrolase [Sphingomonas glaciei]